MLLGIERRDGVDAMSPAAADIARVGNPRGLVAPPFRSARVARVGDVASLEKRASMQIVTCARTLASVWCQTGRN